MADSRAQIAPLPKSVWDNDEHLVHLSSSSTTELHTKRISTLSPVQRFTDIRPSHQLERAGDTSEKGCLGCATRQRAILFVLVLAFICATAVLLPIVLLNTVGLKTDPTTTVTTTATITSTSSSTTSSDTTTTTTSSTSTTSTTKAICATGCANVSTTITSRLAFYSFDSNTNDITGTYSASGISSPTYVTGYVGSAISFNAALSQRLSAPAMELNTRSFTIEFWFSLTNSASSTYAFFGQLSVPNTAQNCLFLVSAGGNPYIGFFADDLRSSTVLQSNTWYHAAFVYDVDVRQQRIYINGLLDTQSATGVGAYYGTSGVMTIGGADIYGGIGVPYLTGLMDHLTVSTRAKSACEILNDATLVAYFPFDGNLTDSGPNFLTATSSGVSFTSGFVNQAAYLSGSASYIQISSFTGLGIGNNAYSIAFWIYPIVSGILVHISTTSAGTGWCTHYVGMSSSGNLITLVYAGASSSIITGPVLQTSTWTHIVQTYSSTNGQRLYVNGALYSSISGTMTYSASGAQDYFTFGSALNGTYCFNPGTLLTPFQGMVDELRVYSRELSSIDVCLLAWP